MALTTLGLGNDPIEEFSTIIILTQKKGNMMQEKEQLVLSYNFYLFRNGKYNWTVFVYYFFGLPRAHFRH